MSFTIKMNPELIHSVLQSGVGRIKYEFGGKVKTLLQSLPNVKKLDCSGFIRMLVFKTTPDHLEIPDGSWNQREWCKSMGFKETLYEHCLLHDGRVRLCFLPTECNPNHVWACWNGLTVECCSRKGVTQQLWTVYRKRKPQCWVLTDPL